MKKLVFLLVFLFSLMTTCQTQARSVKPESIVPDIKDYTIVKMSPCNPPNHASTRMCLIIEKDGKQLMSIHDIETKQVLEIRDGQKIIWHYLWEAV